MFNKIYLPCLFGVESILAQELQDLGYAKSQIEVNDAMVSLTLAPADDFADHVAYLNINLRTAERVLLGLARGRTEDFDQLYELVKGIAWTQILDPGYFIEVKGYSRKSKLHSLPACQRIIKKAIVDRMLESRPGEGRDKGRRAGRGDKLKLEENPKKGINRIQFALVKDSVQIFLETSGDPLHKRGYRPISHKAPLRETLAAAILALSFYKKNIANREVLWDPFCGSGTFPIEAALVATETAPGLGRKFAAEKYQIIGQKCFVRQRKLAKDKSLLYREDFKLCEEADERHDFLLPGQRPRIFASDISEEALAMTLAHAKRAGVAKMLEIFQKDIHQAKLEELTRRFSVDRVLICGNPPYGERLDNPAAAKKIAKSLASLCFTTTHELKPGLRLSLISSDEKLEEELGRAADKRRNLYNGALKCTLYHYFKSPRRKASE